MMRSAADENVMVVAVAAKVDRPVSGDAVSWAFKELARPGDVVTLLAVLIDNEDRRRGWRRWLWGLPKGKVGGRATAAGGRGNRFDITTFCSAAMLQVDAPTEVEVVMRLIGPDSEGWSSGKAVLTESKRLGANWIILDKQLKEETENCKELQCNIVVVKGTHAEMLRVNRGGQHKSYLVSTSRPPCNENPGDDKVNNLERKKYIHDVKALSLMKNRLSISSVSTMEADSNEATCSDSGSSATSVVPELRSRESSSISSASFDAKHNHPPSSILKDFLPAQSCNTNYGIKSHQLKSTLHDELYAEKRVASPEVREVREVTFATNYSPSNPRPLCSLCQHKSPAFGNPPIEFTYQELEQATSGFSDTNLIGKGRHGYVYKGALEDGIVVAVKRLKASDVDSRGDGSFRSKVNSMSRVQHRNTVLLIGLCFQGTLRMMVYEYICNGSLELHLHEKMKPPLNWETRRKIALGAARGLRYLHEDCRAGFNVHGDVRSSNILLTHDFEALVGDISGCQKEDSEFDFAGTRGAGTFGYQAPETLEYGHVTKKVDVYAYGVILLEILTGRRAVDMSQPKGQQLLTEWAQPLLEVHQTIDIYQFLDPLLDRHEEHRFLRQLQSMSCAASMCLRREPDARPDMSTVLGVLEGDSLVNPGLDVDPIISRSSRMSIPIRDQDTTFAGSCSLRFSNEPVTNVRNSKRTRPRFS